VNDKLCLQESQDSDYKQQLSSRYGSLGRPLRQNLSDKENFEYGSQSKSLDRRAFANSGSKPVPPKIVVTPSNSDAMDKVGSNTRLRYFGETDAEDGGGKWGSSTRTGSRGGPSQSTLTRKHTMGEEYSGLIGHRFQCPTNFD